MLDIHRRTGNFHRRTGYLLLVVVLGQIILISAQVQTSSGVKVLHAVTFGIFSEVQLGAARVFGGVRAVWDGYFALRGTHQENEQLKQQVAELELRLQQQQALARRGAELQQVLDLRATTSLKTLAADVIAGDSTGVFRIVTIDRGSQHGVRQDMAVIAPQGIVGRVIDQPSMFAAKVQLLLDRNAGAGAMVERSGAGGVVVGHGDTPLHMEWVSNLADVKVQDLVVSSGIDGIYPRGFVIGHVQAVKNGAGLYKEIAIQPVVDFTALQTVLVVLDPPSAAGAAMRSRVPVNPAVAGQPPTVPAASPASAAPAPGTPAASTPATATPAPSTSRPPATVAPSGTAPPPPTRTPPPTSPPPPDTAGPDRTGTAPAGPPGPASGGRIS
jgi:rod shape-determining protein MreC